MKTAMIRHRLQAAILALAACAAASSASAQKQPDTSCPPAQTMKAEQLFGRWAVHFSHPPAGWPERATMQLQRHAEFSESLAGTVSRKLKKPAAPATAASAPVGPVAQAALAGDLDEGMLLLDESADNISITGTWNGEMVAGSCGRAFQGLWRDTSASAAPDAPGVPFTLTRLP